MVLPTDFISLLKGSLSSFRKLKILAACIVLWFLWAHFFSSSAEVSNSIILLKLPRSGSSWLTDELNAVSAVYVAKEILQTNDSLKLESEVVEKHLSEALLFPSDKAWRPYSWTMLPTTRYLEDYVYSGKFLASLKFVGFSLNPEHIPSENALDWLTSCLHPFVLLLRRQVECDSAKPKTDIADFDQTEHHKICHIRFATQ